MKSMLMPRTSAWFLMAGLILLVSAGMALAQNLGGEEMWYFDSNLRVGHVATAELNGDGIPDVIAAEFNPDYYGDPSQVFGIDGKTGDTLWIYWLQDGARVMAIGDINGDGITDVAIGASYNASGTPDGYVHAINGIDGSEIWKYYIGASNNAIDVGDINGDAYMDVVVGSFDDQVHAINGQTGTALWVRNIGSLWINSVAIADVDGDLTGDVLYAHEYLAGYTNYMGVLDGVDGSDIWQLATNYVPLRTIVDDFDGDSQLDAIFGIEYNDETMAVQCRDALTGALKWEDTLGVGDGVNNEIYLFAHDIDGDGDPDLLVGHGGIGYFYNVYDGADATPMYTSDTLSGYVRSAAFADVTGDGRLNVVAATYDRVQVLDAENGTKDWYFSVAGRIAAVAVGDFDDDGITDITAGGTAETVGWPPDPGKTVWAIRTVQSPLLWEFEFGQYGNAVAVGDLNGDEFEDVVVVASLGDRLWAIDGKTGDELWHWTGTSNLFAVTIGDFDGDGIGDVAVGGYDEAVTALRGSDGSIMWTFTTMTDDVYRRGLASADLNGDGSDDVIAGSKDNSLYAISGATGLELWSNTYSGDVLEVEVAQMDGIGPLDVVAVITGSSPIMVVLEGSTGDLLWSYDTDIGNAAHVEVLDANGDGIPDVAIGTRYTNSKVVVVDGATHTMLWSATVPLTSEYGLSHGDLNGDKADDLITGGSSSSPFVRAFDGPTGTELWTYSCGGEVNVVLAHDISGDGIPDVLAGSDDRILHWIDPLTGDGLWQYSCAGDVMHIAVGDISGDGVPNMACVTFGSDGRAYAFKSFYQEEPGCCVGIRGNVDGDPADQINVQDLTYLVAFLFTGGPQPPCPEEANVDGDPGESMTVQDVTYLVAYLFSGGPPPPACP
jgi:outer membrane protein assembly factor BamB